MHRLPPASRGRYGLKRQRVVTGGIMTGFIQGEGTDRPWEKCDAGPNRPFDYPIRPAPEQCRQLVGRVSICDPTDTDSSVVPQFEAARSASKEFPCLRCGLQGKLRH